MPNLPNVESLEGLPGVTVKRYCSFCTEAADGDLSLDDGAGNIVPVPVCEGCVKVLMEKYSEKFDK